MKRLLLALLLVSAIACGGGGDDSEGPTDPVDTGPKFDVTGGTFDVTTRMEFNGCDLATDWAGTYDLVIDSTNAFTMGPFTGTFDDRVTCTGETVRQHHTTRECKVTTWTSINIKFIGENGFDGTIIYRLRLGGECGDRSTCTTSWSIVGSRQPAVP